MIKSFIHQFLHLADNGKLLKSPYKWAYVLSGALCFLPLVAFMTFVVVLWDEVITLLGNGFWNNFVSVFVLVLFVYTLLIYGLIGWHFWWNRKNNLDNVIPDNSRFVAIPLISDGLLCSGQILCVFMVFVPFVAGLLAYVACLLTNGFDIYEDFNFLIYLLAFVVGMIAVVLVAYLYLLFIQFVCERIRLLPQISNDVQGLRKGEKYSEPAAQVTIEQPATPPLKTIVIALIVAIVLALGVAFYISIANKIAMSKSIYKPLKETRVLKLSAEHENFYSFYDDVREACGVATDTAKFEEIKYSRLYKYIEEYYANDEFKKQIEDEAHKIFDEQHLQPLMDQVDGIVEEWELYMEENNPDAYLIVKTYTDIYEEESWYYTYDRPEYWFSTREPNGEVVDASITYVPLNEYGRKPSGVSINKCDLKELQKHRSRKTSCYYASIDDKSFWDNYTMDVTINYVEMEDGTVIYASDLDKVPASVRNYIASPSEKNLEALIKDQINNGFVARDEFIAEMVSKSLKDQDPLCFDFIEGLIVTIGE